ncbi:MAG: DUF4345 domain-containing protein [Deltaproteobacteria bacterium]|nr:MAG: DUF4345 domain-containing protein [Deltaproteobacteria bacterium]
MSKSIRSESGFLSSPLQWFGLILLLGGVVLTFAPTLVYDPGPAKDLFRTIERRIPWGGLAGLGLLFVLHTQWKPWQASVAALVCWATTGAIFARLVGLALDGVGSSKQWMWVVAEAVVIAVAGFFLWKFQGKNDASPSEVS